MNTITWSFNPGCGQITVTSTVLSENETHYTVFFNGHNTSVNKSMCK